LSVDDRALKRSVDKDAQQAGLWTSSAYVTHIVNGLHLHDAPPEYIQHVIETAIRTNEHAAIPNEETRRNITEQAHAINRLR